MTRLLCPGFVEPLLGLPQSVLIWFSGRSSFPEVVHTGHVGRFSFRDSQPSVKLTDSKLLGFPCYLGVYLL